MQKIAAPLIIADRFELTTEMREGGMAEVYKAFDAHADGAPCAVKRMKLQADEDAAKESFYREYRALEALEHRNIVRMLDYGLDDLRRPYIAMEWVERDLDSYIDQHSALGWSDFWRQIGQPILEAISAAQSKLWIHRDIKPKNILMTDSGEPKLSDYGIARVQEYDVHLALNRPTFRAHGSKPFTPPEDDDGCDAFHRDCFSWAVVAVFCLTGRVPADYGNLPEMIAGIPDAPTEILARACSMSPGDRPRNAALLLDELDQWTKAHQSTATPKLSFWLTFSDPVKTHLANIFGPEERNPVEAVLQDFCRGVRARLGGDDGEKVRFLGENWQIVAIRDPRRPGCLLVERAQELGSAAVDRQKERAPDVEIRLNAAAPPNPDLADGVIDEIFAYLVGASSELARKKGLESDRILRIWQTYLRARSAMESGQASDLRYSDAKVSDRTVTLTLTDPVPPDLLGQDRKVRSGSRYLFFEVTAVLGDEVTLRSSYGDPALVPSNGVLEVNTDRASRAIDRQRQALDAVANGRSAHTGLREIVLGGQNAKPPLSAVPFRDAGEQFDDDKLVVLKKALGTQDILAVEGPPGTGKTRLIEEIISQYLYYHPKHRVLLSSQTHAALDNVIERLAKRHSHLDLVRVGRYGDEKIADSASGFILERKAETWSTKVAANARKWLEARAAREGLDETEMRAGSLSLRLAALLKARQVWQEATAERSRQAIQTTKTAAEEESEGVATANLERSVEVSQQSAAEARSKLGEVEAEIEEAREALRGLQSVALNLAESESVEDLEGYGEMLLGDSESHRKHLSLIHLQEQWLERVGRSVDFQAAMLASADVVASTCVAITGVKGITEVSFDLCIIDEASRATATEVLVPMSRSRRTILVGDTRQLPAFFERDILTSKMLAEFTEAEITENVFDRLLKTLPAEARADLRKQYRMARPIGDLVSQVFYEGRLESPKLKAELSLPLYPKLVTWLDTGKSKGQQEVRVGTSWRNPAECAAVKKAIEQIAFVASNRKGAHYQIAVIAGYQAQVSAIEHSIRDQRIAWPNLTIRVNTVDAFQGSEADICIYSVVRSNDQGDAGFLKEPPRLNVALSRARNLLLIVGDYEFCRGLAAAHPMSDVVDYIATHEDDCEVRLVP